MLKVNWQIEEAIMLVDLYNRTLNMNSEEKRTEIDKLSNILNKRADTLRIPRDEKFRNANGIIIQLSNLRYIDTEGAEGLSAYSESAVKTFTLYKTLPGIFSNLVEEFFDRYQ